MHWKIKFQLREFSAWTRRLFLADVCLGHAKAQGFMRSILFILHICLDRSSAFAGCDGLRWRKAKKELSGSRQLDSCRLIVGTLCIVLAGFVVRILPLGPTE